MTSLSREDGCSNKGASQSQARGRTTADPPGRWEIHRLIWGPERFGQYRSRRDRSLPGRADHADIAIFAHLAFRTKVVIAAAKSARQGSRSAMGSWTRQFCNVTSSDFTRRSHPATRRATSQRSLGVRARLSRSALRWRLARRPPCSGRPAGRFSVRRSRVRSHALGRLTTRRGVGGGEPMQKKPAGNPPGL